MLTRGSLHPIGSWPLWKLGFLSRRSVECHFPPRGAFKTIFSEKKSKIFNCSMLVCISLVVINFKSSMKQVSKQQQQQRTLPFQCQFELALCLLVIMCFFRVKLCFFVYVTVCVRLWAWMTYKMAIAFSYVCLSLFAPCIAQFPSNRPFTISWMCVLMFVFHFPWFTHIILNDSKQGTDSLALHPLLLIIIIMIWVIHSHFNFWWSITMMFSPQCSHTLNDDEERRWKTRARNDKSAAFLLLQESSRFTSGEREKG